MFAKSALFAALLAGASAVSPAAYGEQPAGYGGENTNTAPAAPAAPVPTTSYAVPPAYEAPIDSASTPDARTDPATAPAYIKPSSFESTPTRAPTDSVSLPVESTPTQAPTASVSLPVESTPTQAPTASVSLPVESRTSPASDKYTTATYTSGGAVYTTYCPESEASKYTTFSESKTESIPARPTAPESKSTPYSPEKPTETKDIPSYGQPPRSTGYPSKPVEQPTASPSETVDTKTLTYTLGDGASTTVLTTTIEITSTIFRTSTVYATKSQESKPVAPTYPVEAPKETSPAQPPVESKPVGPTEGGEKSESRGFKTVKSTSTITNTITVYPTRTEQAPNKPTSPVENSPDQPSRSAPVYDCKPSTTTVTEKETIYVTVPAARPTESKPVEDSPKPTSSTPVEAPKPSSSAPVEAPRPSKSAPYYPTGPSSKTSGHAASTGFATKYTKPADKPSAPIYNHPWHTESSTLTASATASRTESVPTVSVSTAYVVPIPSTPASPEQPERPAGYETPAGY